MLETRHRWALELLDPSGGPSESFPLGDRVDWEPAEECARWSAVRSGAFTPEQAWAAPASVTPIASARLGEPYASGFEIRLDATGDDPFVRTFPTVYFKSLAETCAASWIRSGRLSAGDRFRYLITTYLGRDRTSRAPSGRAAIRTLAPTVPIEEPGRDDWRAAPLPESAGPVDDADPPVLIPRSILLETSDHALSRPDVETGGFVLGRLIRHPHSGDVVTVVTGYLPARSEGTATRLSFTPECWTAARSAIALRGGNETLVGWVHSHIVDALCAGCAEETRRDCPLASGFFSEHDRSVHRIAFPRAYQVALVVNLSGGRTTHSCFGWRDGTVVVRGFHIPGESEARSCPGHA